MNFPECEAKAMKLSKPDGISLTTPPFWGFILNTVCTIAPHMPTENMEILYEVIEKYGYY